MRINDILIQDEIIKFFVIKLDEGQILIISMIYSYKTHHSGNHSDEKNSKRSEKKISEFSKNFNSEKIEPLNVNKHYLLPWLMENYMN